MAAATEERMIRLWASPQGALKSALAGIQDPPIFSVRPRHPGARRCRNGR